MLKNLVTEYVDNGETKDVVKSEEKNCFTSESEMFLKGGEPKNVLKSAAEMILRVKQKLSI